MTMSRFWLPVFTLWQRDLIRFWREKARVLGFVALMLASVNIFGGFLVTQRMLGMYRKKEGRDKR